MKFQQFSKLLIAAGFLALAACDGKGLSYIKDAKISTYTQGTDQYVSLSTTVDAVQIIMPVAQVPIMDPKDSSKMIGFVQVTPNLSAGTELRVDMDMTAISQFKHQSWDGTLPNGLPVPVGGFDPSKSFAIPLTQGSKAYINLDMANKKALIGAALGLKEFKTGVTAGLFLPFSFDKEVKVSGLAGIFTGPQQYQSGFAVFADVSSVFDLIHGLSQQVSVASVSAKATSAKVPYSFKSASKNSNAIYDMLYRVNANKTRVNLQ